MWKYRGHVDVEPKIGVFTPKMDGENNGKPYFLMNDLGVFPYFWFNTHIANEAPMSSPWIRFGVFTSHREVVTSIQNRKSQEERVPQVSPGFEGVDCPLRIHGTGIFTYIYHKNQPNVGKYTIHGSYVLEFFVA